MQLRRLLRHRAGENRGKYMKKEKNRDCQEREPYFWERIQQSTVEKWMYGCLMGLCTLPLFVALTGRGWIYLFLGSVNPSNEVNLVLGNYWNFLVQFLSIFMGGCLIFKYASTKKKVLRKPAETAAWVRSHWLTCSLAALLLWSTLSLFFAGNKVRAFWGDDYYHAGLLLLICGCLIFKVSSGMTEKQMKMTLEVLTAVCAVTGLFVHCSGFLFGTDFYCDSRYKFMFHNSNHYGIFLAIGAATAMGLMLQDRKYSLLSGLARTVELWLIFNAMAACSSRGSFLPAAVILVIWNLYAFCMKKHLRKRVVFLDALFLLTVFCLNTGSLLSSTLQNILFNILNIIHGADKTEAFDAMGTGRGRLWRYGIQFAMEKPLFGYGPSGLYEPYMDMKSLYYSPHNCLILIAASAGFPAMLFYLSGLTGHLIGFLRYLKKMTVLEISLYGAVGAYLMNSLFASWIYYTTPYYFMVLGFSYGVYRKYRDQESRNLSR